MLQKMINQVLFTALITTSISLSSVAIDKEATFLVSSGDKLEVSIRQGNINVKTWGKNEVYMLAKNIEDDEVSLLSIEQKSGKIEIDFMGEESDDFELELSIPSTLNLELSTGGGNILVEGNIDGKMDVVTGGGNISTDNIDGSAGVSTGGGNLEVGGINGNADLSTGGGDVKVVSVNGIADISTGGGNISVGSINNSADISTAGGNINVNDIGGSADISTAGGNIKVGNVSGSADISTAGGNISLDGANGKVETNTAAGNVSCKNITGSLEANTAAGNIYAELRPDGTKRSELNTAVGNITLKIPGTAKATIVATYQVLMWGGDESDLDNIQSDFEPKNIIRNRERKQIEVTYELNGGGSKIELNVAMGEIEIRKLR